jgi:hypothetical protein
MVVAIGAAPFGDCAGSHAIAANAVSSTMPARPLLKVIFDTDYRTNGDSWQAERSRPRADFL